MPAEAQTCPADQRCRRVRMSDVNEMVRLSTEPHGVLPRRVCWIGDGSDAGRPIIAGRIAVPHGMRVYATDNVGRHSSP